jgi:hypothetical protein
VKKSIVTVSNVVNYLLILVVEEKKICSIIYLHIFFTILCFCLPTVHVKIFQKERDIATRFSTFDFDQLQPRVLNAKQKIYFFDTFIGFIRKRIYLCKISSSSSRSGERQRAACPDSLVHGDRAGSRRKGSGLV